MTNNFINVQLFKDQCDQMFILKLPFFKGAQTEATICQNSPNNHPIFWLLLQENLSPRSFKFAQSGHTDCYKNILSLQQPFCYYR